VLPAAWERYSQADQAKILSRLLVIRDMAATIEQPPQPIDTLPLAEAEQRWQDNS